MQSFSNQDRELLLKIEALLKLGAEVLPKIKIDSSTEPRLFIFYSMVCAVHNYTEAILVLAREAKKEAGMVLLRCLIETLINAQYILQDMSGVRAAAFVIADERDRKKLMINLTNFFKSHPDYAKSFQDRSDEERQKYIQQREKEIANLGSKYKNKLHLPNLRQRAIDTDIKTSKQDSEFNYLTVYWYFSHFTHLTARGLDNFLSESADGASIVNIGKNFNGLNLLLMSAFDAYLGFLGSLSNNFNVPTDDELQPFEEYFINLNKSR